MNHRYFSFKCALLASGLAFGLFARSASAQEVVPATALVAGTSTVVGPFANAAGTDKVFRFVGTADVTVAGTIPQYRFCWAAGAGAATFTQCSQWINGAALGVGVGQAIDSGSWWLPGACPLTVWIQLYGNSAFTISGTFTHVCGGVPNPPGATKVVPTYPGSPGKKVLLSYLGASNGGPIVFKIVANGASCDAAAAPDLFNTATLTPTAGNALCPVVAPAPDLVKTLGNLLNSAPNIPGSFPSVTGCVAGITRIGNDPRGQWDVCVGDGTTFTKVFGQQLIGYDLTGSPIFNSILGSTTVNGITIAGVAKGKHPVPALSTLGVVGLSALMLVLGVMMLRRNRRGSMSV